MANISRNRVTYQCDAVFAGPTPATGAHTTSGQNYNNLGAQMSGTSNVNQLTRLQSVGWTASVNRQTINQIGELAGIDQIILEQPNVSLDLTWNVANLANEKYIGLTVTPTGSSTSITCISGILSKVSDEKNYFVVQAGEGIDANNNSNLNVDGTNTYGFGNMFLSSYETRGAVNEVPQTTVRLEGLNYVVQTGTAYNPIPAVSPTDGTRVNGWFYTLGTPTSNSNPGTGDLAISSLRHGDITLAITESGTNAEFHELGATASSVSGAVQGYSFSYNLNRESLQKLGTQFAYAKEVTYPLEVNASINGLVTALNTGALETFICNDKTYNIDVSIKRPGCEASRPVVAKYRLVGAKLANQSYSMNIGQNKTFTYDFTAQVGSATQTQGLFLSGSVGN